MKQLKINTEVSLKRTGTRGILFSMRRIHIVSVLFLSICFFMAGNPLETFAFSTQSADIALSPQYPEPESRATASLAGNPFATLGGEVSWFIDGVELTSAKNERSIFFTTKKVGESTTVSARITNNDGVVSEVRKVITPLRVDIIISADTYTPSFYQGRALPSSAGVITARALVFTDTQEPVGKYSYIWKVNGSIQNNSATKSDNSVRFSPNYETKLPISVEIINTSGDTIAKKTIEVPINSPEIYFYALNPLRGVMPIVLRDSYYLLEKEVTLRAEPYYIEKNSSAMATEWEIDNINTQSDANPYEITLAKQVESGDATITFKLYNTNEFLQSAKATLRLTF